jgi:hypothetical protein
MRQHQRGTVHRLDHFGDGEGLARAGRAQQNLMLQLGFEAIQQRLNGGGLVAHRFVFGLKLKSTLVRHGALPFAIEQTFYCNGLPGVFPALDAAKNL